MDPWSFLIDDEGEQLERLKSDDGCDYDSPMAEMLLHCPLCSHLMAVDSSMAGHQVACPTCQGVVAIPAEPPQEPPRGFGMGNPYEPPPPNPGYGNAPYAPPPAPSAPPGYGPPPSYGVSPEYGAPPGYGPPPSYGSPPPYGGAAEYAPPAPAIDSSATFNLACPLCTGVFQLPMSMQGQQVACPYCGGVVQVPSFEPTPAIPSGVATSPPLGPPFDSLPLGAPVANSPPNVPPAGATPASTSTGSRPIPISKVKDRDASVSDRASGPAAKSSAPPSALPPTASPASPDPPAPRSTWKGDPSTRDAGRSAPRDLSSDGPRKSDRTPLTPPAAAAGPVPSSVAEPGPMSSSAADSPDATAAPSPLGLLGAVPAPMLSPPGSPPLGVEQAATWQPVPTVAGEYSPSPFPGGPTLPFTDPMAPSAAATGGGSRPILASADTVRIPSDAVAVLSTEDGELVPLRNPVKTIGKPGEEIELRQLTPVERARRRLIRNTVMATVCLLLLTLVFVVLLRRG